MQARLHADDPHLYNSWFAAVTAVPVVDGMLRLTAPSRFHSTYLRTNHAARPLALVSAVDALVTRIEIATARE